MNKEITIRNLENLKKRAEKMVIRENFRYPAEKRLSKMLGAIGEICLYQGCENNNCLDYIYCPKHLKIMVNRVWAEKFGTNKQNPK